MSVMLHSMANLLKTAVQRNLHLLGVLRYALAGVVFLLPNMARYYDVMSEGIFALSRLLPLLAPEVKSSESDTASSTTPSAISLVEVSGRVLVALAQLTTVLELMLEKAVLVGLFGDGNSSSSGGSGALAGFGLELTPGRELLRANLIATIESIKAGGRLCILLQRYYSADCARVSIDVNSCSGIGPGSGSCSGDSNAGGATMLLSWGSLHLSPLGMTDKATTASLYEFASFCRTRCKDVKAMQSELDALTMEISGSGNASASGGALLGGKAGNPSVKLPQTPSDATLYIGRRSGLSFLSPAHVSVRARGRGLGISSMNLENRDRDVNANTSPTTTSASQTSDELETVDVDVDADADANANGDAAAGSNNNECGASMGDYSAVRRLDGELSLSSSTYPEQRDRDSCGGSRGNSNVSASATAAAGPSTSRLPAGQQQVAVGGWEALWNISAEHLLLYGELLYVLRPVVFSFTLSALLARQQNQHSGGSNSNSSRNSTSGNSGGSGAMAAAATASTFSPDSTNSSTSSSSTSSNGSRNNSSSSSVVPQAVAWLASLVVELWSLKLTTLALSRTREAAEKAEADSTASSNSRSAGQGLDAADPHRAHFSLLQYQQQWQQRERIMELKHLLAKKRSERHAVEAELSRRKFVLLLYAIRSPVFDTATLPLLHMVTNFVSRVPFLSVLPECLINSLTYVNKHHFYHSSST